MKRKKIILFFLNSLREKHNEVIRMRTAMDSIGKYFLYEKKTNSYLYMIYSSEL